MWALPGTVTMKFASISHLYTVLVVFKWLRMLLLMSEMKWF